MPTFPPPPATDRDAIPRRHWLALAAVLAAVKLAWYLADHTPMLFLGDSESYLTTATIGWIPPDRSFLYGYVLRLLALRTGSLQPLIAVQAACGVVVALLLASLLAGAFAIPKRVAFAVAIAWAALEPLALLYERYLMTEALALLAFAAFVTLSIRYLAARRLRDVVLAQAAATIVIAFRTVFVPVSLAFAVLLPALGWALRPTGDGRPAWRAAGAALVVSIAATLLFHQAYKVVNGRLSAAPAAYQYADGLFLLAAWSPVLAAEDFDDRALGAAVIAQSNCKLADRHAREAQRWYPGCIVDVLLRQLGNDEARANRTARAAAYRALRRDPVGVARLALATWLDGFEPERLRAALRWDRGEFAFQPATVVLLRDRLGVPQAAELHRLETPTNRWHGAAVPWVMLLEVTPLVALLALVVCPVRVRRNMAFVFLLATCVMGATAIAATGPVPRYSHAMAWLIMIPLAVIGTRLAGARSRSSRAAA